jgi:hypothetical protein
MYPHSLVAEMPEQEWDQGYKPISRFANVVVWLVSDQSKPLSGEFIARDPHRGSVSEK